MEDPTLTIADFERAMVALFPVTDVSRSKFTDSDLDNISQLLDQVGKPQWSCRPRTYAVLRMIDRIDLFDAFILDGLKDIAFPYTASRLPSLLTPTAKASFLQTQNFVLTKASDLEKSGGRHRHLDEDSDTHFHVLKILGRGGFGEVHHIRSKLSLEEYARKRVHRKKAFSKDREAIKIFENELTNLKRLTHHHLVKVVGGYDLLRSYTDPKYIGLLMSPVADCDLKVFLERDPFPQEDIHLLRGFFGCLCSAVLYLHNSKCRHKDLKPGNILVHAQNVLITDFGTARDWSEQSRSITTGRSSAYTPGYAAPEVVDDEPRRSSADIWSLGCVLIDMMTVLKGETIASKNQFFGMNGTGGANPRSNARALDLWLAHLGSKEDEVLVEWIKEMIKRVPNERITAAGLMERIHSYDDGHVYYNSCCNGDEDSENGTSYQGSIFEEDAISTQNFSNLDEPWVNNGAANTMLLMSGQDPNQASMQHQELPLKPLQSREEIDLNESLNSLGTAGDRADMDYHASQLLLDSGSDVHEDYVKVDDALPLDANSVHASMIQQLKDNRIGAKAADVDGETVLQQVAKKGDDIVAPLEEDASCLLDTKDGDGKISIHQAAEEGRQKWVQPIPDSGGSIKQSQMLDENWNSACFTNFTLPKFQRPSQEYQEAVYCIQLSGDHLVSAGRDHKIRIWNIKTGILVREPLRGHTASVLCMRFDQSKQEDVIISAGSDCSFIIWKFSTGELRKRVDLAHESSIISLSFDENYLVTCSKDRLIKVWNRKWKFLSDAVNNGFRPPYSAIKTLAGHTAAINQVQIDGDEIISASGDRMIKIWKLETGECLRTIHRHSRGIACFQLEGRHIISGSHDHTLKIFDRQTLKEEYCLVGHTGLVRSVQASFEDNRIVSGSYDGTVIVWHKDASGSWVVQHRLDQFKSFVTRPVIPSDGQEPIGANDLPMDAKLNPIFSVRFDRRFLVACTQDGRVVVWDFANGDESAFKDP